MQEVVVICTYYYGLSIFILGESTKKQEGTEAIRLHLMIVSPLFVCLSVCLSVCHR